MKKLLLLSLLLISISLNAQDTLDLTNDFYDNAETHQLPITSIEVAGEIANPGIIDLTKLPDRSVVVKETLLDQNADKFIGAYRYDGYSLYDILNKIVIKKNNEKEYSPIIDLFVIIENNKGEKAIFSWGEIYYPIHRHEIILANKVARIIPSKTKDLWVLPTQSKIISAADLITERNISSPTKITVKSFPKSFPTQKGMENAFSPEIKIFINNKNTRTLNVYPSEKQNLNYPVVFYGRGKGIHGVKTFMGIQLKEVLSNEIKLSKENIQQCIILIVANDGYRGVYTMSEVFNRNDQSEFLLIDRKSDDKFGIFSVYAAPDFFSDRAIKAISEIHIVKF